MRSGSTILTLVVLGVSTLLWLCSPASAQHRSRGQVDIDVFYDGLAPYGEWVEMPDYGWSWAPRVERGWRPYTRGHWVLTDDGWYWDSDEAFGWAAYHYGRWVDDPYYGWVWVPGTEWAPAWVSWRHGDGYTGWAPLPPRATWRTRFGLSIGGLEIDAFLGANDYVFVRDRSFVDRGVYQRVLPRERNRGIIGRTRNVTNYSYANERIINRGVDSAIVERAVGRRIQRARTVDLERAEPSRRDRVGEVSVFRPDVRASVGRRPAQGRSLVRGDNPSPLLLQRRAERTRERQQRGREAELTARDAAQPREVRPSSVDRQPAPRPDAKTEAQDAARQRDRARQAAEERARNQKQQNREKSQVKSRQQKQTREAGEDERAQALAQQRQTRERSQANTRQQQERAHQTAEDERGKRQGPPHVDQEKPQPNGQEQREQARAKRERDEQTLPGGRAKDTRKETNDRSQERGRRAPKAEPPAKERREH